MSKIFSGYLLIFLEFNLTIGMCTIGFFPDFIGYICIVSGLSELTGDGAHFRKARPLAVGMAVYSAIVYILSFFGKTVGAWWLTILTMLCALIISYMVVMGIGEIETKYHADLSSHSVNICWIVMAVFQVVSLLGLWIPFFSLFAILGLVASIVFVVMFFQSCKLYDMIPHKY